MGKKILSLLLAFALVFSLVLSISSCIPDKNEDTENPPNDDITNDATTDNNEVLTEDDADKYLPITESGEAKITVVSAYSKSAKYAEGFNSFTSAFKDAGIKLTLAYAASEDSELPEILIGDRINAVGDCYIDPHSLGDEGYAIRVVGNKIIVAGGSDESLVKAIKLLCDSVLCLGDSDTDIANLSVSRSTDIFVRQDYPIRSISVGGNDLFGYTIVCNVYDADQKYCAEILHGALYDRAGYWLNVKAESDGPAIRISLTADAGVSGFKVYTDGDDLIIACAYPALLLSSVESFISDIIIDATKSELKFADEVYSRNIGVVRYSDYGAIGDGVTDDYQAIKDAHNIANQYGLMVVAESGKTYNLGQHITPIVIQTDTIWDGATFIIDDSTVEPGTYVRSSAVFSVRSSKSAAAVMGIKSLSKGQENVGVTFDSPMLLHVVCEDIRQYIRYGNNADSGASQQEIILVDENGNVDPSTPIMWDYPSVTYVTGYCAADDPVLISGGKFITVANRAPREYTYYMRNLDIKRSNVTVVGLEHYITDEGDTGAPYNGFISISTCHNILIKDTILTGHKVYKLSTDSTNAMGTYDIAISNSNAVTFKDCRQSNSITDTTYWGIMGSNYCKNLTYDGCVFSRFDAHKGTHNATIINSEIGHQKLSVIGSGTLRVENTVVHGNNIVSLRVDYGSTWNGDMIFKNVTLKNTGTATLINASWYNHYFGYTCYLPENIIIDGITLAKGNSFYVLPKLTTGIDTDTVSGSNNLNKVVLTKTVTVLANPNGYSYSVSSNTTLFKDVELKEE